MRMEPAGCRRSGGITEALRGVMTLMAARRRRSGSITEVLGRMTTLVAGRMPAVRGESLKR